MKKSLLFLASLTAVISGCETGEKDYFVDDDLVILKLQSAPSFSSYATSSSKLFTLRRVKNPDMVTELHEDGVRVMTSKVSYNVGDTIRVALIDKSLFSNYDFLK